MMVQCAVAAWNLRVALKSPLFLVGISPLRESSFNMKRKRGGGGGGGEGDEDIETRSLNFRSPRR